MARREARMWSAGSGRRPEPRRGRLGSGRRPLPADLRWAFRQATSASRHVAEPYPEPYPYGSGTPAPVRLQRVGRAERARRDGVGTLGALTAAPDR